MLPWIFFLAGGPAFVLSVAMLLVAILVASRRDPQRVRLRRWLTASGRDILFLLALAVLVLSATPLPVWIYATWGFVLSVWIVVEHWPSFRERRAPILRVGAIAASLVAAALELRHAILPALPADHAAPRLYVVGDSISAGVGTWGVTTWPKLVQRNHEVEVIDLSHPGATTGSALNILRKTTLQDGLVFLEIGGNDLFWRPPSDEFRAQLDELLTRVCGAGRRVVMFELPLMPLENYIGRIQRDLAKRHGVTLIPKRYFTSVLGPKENSLDGLHLSKLGQERMAELVWRIVAPAMRTTIGGM